MDGTIDLLEGARTLLETPPPAVDEVDASEIARNAFGLAGEARRLLGERDANFLFAGDGSRPVVLKFVNDAEPDEEALMQVAALAHLRSRAGSPRVPVAVPALDGRSLVRVVTRSGLAVRARCYTYLPGAPLVSRAIDDETRRMVGRTAGRLTDALSGFFHPATRRLNMWDTCLVGGLSPWMEHQPVSPFPDPLAGFLDHFRRNVEPRISGLRRGAVHNDLSPSNLVDDRAGDGLFGVVDFGDMIEAPVVCELAVAASYQMGPETPLRDLATVTEAFEAEYPLTPEERELSPEFVLARLAGRILITRRRAERFPENRVYILRSSEAARSLFRALHPQVSARRDRS